MNILSIPLILHRVMGKPGDPREIMAQGKPQSTERTCKLPTHKLEVGFEPPKL